MKIRNVLLTVALVLFAGACTADSPPSDTAQGKDTKPAAKPAKQPAPAGDYESFNPEEVVKLLGTDELPVLYDCRTAKEFEEAHIPGAINLSHELLPARIEELEPYKDELIVIYCRSGRRARIAYREMEKAGFEKLAVLPGDMLGWKEKNYPLEGESIPESE